MPTFESMRFGALQYNDNDVLELPDGLIGLPHLRRWLMLDMDEGIPVRWLQSLDRADFGLPVMHPVFFAEEFEIAATTAAKRRNQFADALDLITLIIANIHAGGEKVTGNLRAPLVFDTQTRRGAQLALDDDHLSIRQEIDYLKFALAVAGESAENTVPGCDAAATETAPSTESAEWAVEESQAQTVGAHGQ